MVVVHNSDISPLRPSFPLNSTSSTTRVGDGAKPVNEPVPNPTPKTRASLKNLSMPEVNKTAASEATPKSQKTVVAQPGSIPLWLIRLYASHRYSSVVTFLLVMGTLCVYGWSVYTQGIWSRGYSRLQNLQLYERQLTTKNATLKNQMAEEAEKEDTELLSPTTDKIIFLRTTPETLVNKSIDKDNYYTNKSEQSRPMGY